MLRCENVGAFLYTWKEYFISAKIYYKYNAATANNPGNIAYNYGSISIESCAFDEDLTG